MVFIEDIRKQLIIEMLEKTSHSKKVQGVIRQILPLVPTIVLLIGVNTIVLGVYTGSQFILDLALYITIFFTIALFLGNLKSNPLEYRDLIKMDIEELNELKIKIISDELQNKSRLTNRFLDLLFIIVIILLLDKIIFRFPI